MLSPYYRDPTAPDLTTFYVIHRGMRVDSRRLVRALFAASNSGESSPALAEWVRRFIAEIHAHHHVEDTVFFPALVERVPAASELVDHLDHDHVELSRTLDALQSVFDGTMSESAIADALRLAEALCDLLHTHLRIEDDELLPLIYENMTVAEFAPLERAARRATPVSTLSFTVPWVMSHADDAEQRNLLKVAGVPLRVLWWATRRRFARLTSRAFGDLQDRRAATATAAPG